MLLVVDAGNTNVKFGIFQGETLRVQWRLRMDHGRSADEYAALLYPLFTQAGLAFSDITGVALASVVPAATPALLQFFHHAFGREPLQINGLTDIGLHVAYEPPDAVGADRLMDAVAAVHKYGAPCIVIDFGTATTFNAIAAPPSPNWARGAILPRLSRRRDLPGHRRLAGRPVRPRRQDPARRAGPPPQRHRRQHGPRPPIRHRPRLRRPRRRHGRPLPRRDGRPRLPRHRHRRPRRPDRPRGRLHHRRRAAADAGRAAAGLPAQQGQE